MTSTHLYSNQCREEIHLTTTGHKIVAQGLLDLLTAEGLLRPVKI